MPVALSSDTAPSQEGVAKTDLVVWIEQALAVRGFGGLAGISGFFGTPRWGCREFWCVLILTGGIAFRAAQAVAFAAPDQTPATPPAPALTPSAPISDGTIAKAGAALREVAKLQQKYQSQFEVASQARKQDLMQQIGMEATRAIRSHDLSVQEYASVNRSAQTDARVKQRLLDAANRE